MGDDNLENLVQILVGMQMLGPQLKSTSVAEDFLYGTAVRVAHALSVEGEWDRVLAAWNAHEMLARHCAHAAEPSLKWSFLHQAALSNNETACRALIRWGAKIDAEDAEGRSAIDIAKMVGHDEICGLLSEAAEYAVGPWAPPLDACCLPSSAAWDQAVRWTVPRIDRVYYGGVVVEISAGTKVWVDDFGRLLVGWRGSVDPPRNKEGRSLIAGQD